MLFFDEVDALVSARGGAGEHEASRRLKSELLSQIDGVASGGEGGASTSHVMLLATTNKPWALDDAMRRRLERRIYIPLPEAEARRQMLEIHTRTLALAADADLAALAARTEGYSGADLHVVCRDAAMMRMRAAVAGKSPAEIVEMQRSGALEGELALEDFERALETTPPSVAAADLADFERWQEEFGSK